MISGVGRSDIGRRLGRDPVSLTVDACLDAIADAGLDPGDIDGLATYPGGVGYEIGFSEGGVAPIEEALRLRPTWISGGGDVPGPGGSILNAMMAVAAGLCRHVLCYRTVWQTTAGTLGLGNAPDRVLGGSEWRSPFGAISAANWIAMHASQYLHRFGATRELLGHIAVNARANAARNPAAIYRDPMTMDDYLGARMITTPFGLLDCDVPCDAAVAVVVSDAAVAADLPKPAVRVEAAGTQITERISWDQDTVTHEPQVIGPSTHLWSRSRLTHDDIDLALLYDGFTFNAITWIEALRVLRVRRGEGLDRPRTSDRARRCPAAQPPRGTALGRPDARHGVLPRGGHPAPARGGRPAGRRCSHRDRRDRWGNPVGRRDPPA